MGTESEGLQTSMINDESNELSQEEKEYLKNIFPKLLHAVRISESKN